MDLYIEVESVPTQAYTDSHSGHRSLTQPEAHPGEIRLIEIKTVEGSACSGGCIGVHLIDRTL